MAANLASLAALGAPTGVQNQGGAPAPAPARLPPKKRLRPDSASTATGPLRVGEGFLRATAEGEAPIAAAGLAIGTAAAASPAPRHAMRRSEARAQRLHRASHGIAAPEYSAARALLTPRPGCGVRPLSAFPPARPPQASAPACCRRCFSTPPAGVRARARSTTAVAEVPSPPHTLYRRLTGSPAAPQRHRRHLQGPACWCAPCAAAPPRVSRSAAAVARPCWRYG